VGGLPVRASPPAPQPPVNGSGRHHGPHDIPRGDGKRGAGPESNHSCQHRCCQPKKDRRVVYSMLLHWKATRSRQADVICYTDANTVCGAERSVRTVHACFHSQQLKVNANWLLANGNAGEQSGHKLPSMAETGRPRERISFRGAPNTPRKLLCMQQTPGILPPDGWKS
jgi:hypothetical protein